ncbi:hypothetical protein NDU88_004769 [Pleurodeles waltl]|uniref:Uncharacterized protein n=1 Tax=Pleurodeles waltl TaxID=8319 RepID=A0AAV7T8J3_PLEWA|nr:hypothetical protein NDU88_004769 [Pleurodeles waltl]
METYVEKLLLTLFGADSMSKVFIVERAHRSLATRPPPGAPALPIIARILNYKDSKTILKLAREKQPLNFEGNVVSIYPDFTRMVHEARKKYIAVKRRLWQAQIAYAMLYTARLCITYKGKERVFANSQQAQDFLHKYNIGHSKKGNGESRSGSSTPDSDME